MSENLSAFLPVLLILQATFHQNYFILDSPQVTHSGLSSGFLFPYGYIVAVMLYYIWLNCIISFYETQDKVVSVFIIKFLSIIPRVILDIQLSSVAQGCLTLCDPMNLSTPGLPVHHQLPEFTQTHVHRVSDAIQPSYPLLSPSPPALKPSQHQSLFQWVNSLHEVAKVLEFQL